MGEGADVLLGEAGFEERGADVPFFGCADAGAVVAGVVEVQAVQNDVVVLFLGEGGELGVELGLTVVAAVGGVGGVVGGVHLAGFDEVEGGLEDGGEVFDA